MSAEEVFWLCSTPRREREHLQDSPFSKAHAVMCDPSESEERIGRRRSLCGMMPVRGWYTDLMVDTMREVSEWCIRCVLKAAAIGAVVACKHGRPDGCWCLQCSNERQSAAAGKEVADGK